MKRSVDIVVVCLVGGFVVVRVVVVVGRVKAADMLSLLATALRDHELLLPMKFFAIFWSRLQSFLRALERDFS